MQAAEKRLVCSCSPGWMVSLSSTTTRSPLERCSARRHPPESVSFFGRMIAAISFCRLFVQDCALLSYRGTVVGELVKNMGSAGCLETKKNVKYSVPLPSLLLSLLAMNAVRTSSASLKSCCTRRTLQHWSTSSRPPCAWVTCTKSSAPFSLPFAQACSLERSTISTATAQSFYNAVLTLL